MPLGKPKAKYGIKYGSRREIKCFKCAKIGHFAQECQGGCKQSDGLNAELDSRKKKQANKSQIKAGWG